MIDIVVNTIVMIDVATIVMTSITDTIPMIVTTDNIFKEKIMPYWYQMQMQQQQFNFHTHLNHQMWWPYPWWKLRRPRR